MSKHQWKRRWLIAAAIIAAAANTPALADDAAKRDELSSALSHYILQSVPPGIPVSHNPASIKLTDEQRAQIRHVLATRDTEVSFDVDKAASSFQPQTGATIPPSIEPEAFPQDLTAQVPAMQPYVYLKLKGQVLIVDPMSRKIVDLFPEASS
jgi:hypothetical protein